LMIVIGMPLVGQALHIHLLITLIATTILLVVLLAVLAAVGSKTGPFRTGLNNFLIRWARQSEE